MATLIVTTTPQSVTVPSRPNNAAPGIDTTLHLSNEDAAVVMRYGPTNTVTAAIGDGTTRGNPLWQQTTLELPRRVEAAYDIWFVVASGTAELTWNLI